MPILFVSALAFKLRWPLHFKWRSFKKGVSPEIVTTMGGITTSKCLSLFNGKRVPQFFVTIRGNQTTFVAVNTVILTNWVALIDTALLYAPYLARQFSKLHRRLHFWPRELKFCSNLVHYKTKKVAKFQLNISDRSREICVLVTAPKKSRAQQYNEKKTIFTNYTNLDQFWA